MEFILDVKNIRKEYKEFILKDVSLQLQKGSIMGIIGPNGAGKTTTIKIIMNMLKARNGTVEIFGLNYKKDEIEIKNRIGYVGEEQYFYQNKTVKWTEKFVSSFYKNWDSDMFSQLLKEFQISKTKKVKELLGLAASLVLRCDECIKYHLIQSKSAGASLEEIFETFSIALVVGGSIVIPHLREAVSFLDDIEKE